MGTLEAQDTLETQRTVRLATVGHFFQLVCVNSSERFMCCSALIGYWSPRSCGLVSVQQQGFNG